MRAGGFAAQLNFFGQATDEKVEQLRRAVTIQLFSAVILDTPVDTGRLRNHWRVSVGDPDLSAIEATTYEVSGRATIAAVEKTVNASEGDVVLWLSNNLPYAMRIEYDGWSHTKAPEGMVRRNVARFNRNIELAAGGAL